MIELVCAQCGEDLAFPDCLGGTEETCPSCGTTIDIPLAFYDDQDEDMDLSLDAISDDEANRITLANIDSPQNRAASDDAIDLEPEQEQVGPRKTITHSGAGSSWARKANEQASAFTSDDAIDLEEDDADTPRPEIVIEQRSTTQTRKASDLDAPTILAQRNLYLVVDHKTVVAYYHPDGWMIQVKDGYVPAKRNEKVIPSMGSFVLVEVVISQDDHGHNRLAGVRSFALQQKFALKAISGDEAAIFERIASKAVLEDRQRKIIHKYIDTKFLATIWEGAEGLL